MPNHIHGILILKNHNKTIDTIAGDNMKNVDDNVDDNVETRHALSLQSLQQSLQSPKQSSQTIGQKRFQNQGKNTVSSIIGGYKSAVTKHARRLGFNPNYSYIFYYKAKLPAIIENAQNLFSSELGYNYFTKKFLRFPILLVF